VATVQRHSLTPIDMNNQISQVLRSLAVLLENVGYYYVLQFLIADAETVLCCAEYCH
jgi:hypothetical protein